MYPNQSIINKKSYIQKLIDAGEGLKLDFKFEVSDAAKIARSLVAFANTEGGKLLIGVKDNGNISGVRSEEEFYMLQNAAERYCKPEVSFISKEWNIGGKKVLEISIPKSEIIPHKAPDINGIYKVYTRYQDQNILAHSVQVRVWKKVNSKVPVNLKYTDEVKEFLDLFPGSQSIDYQEVLNRSALSKSRINDLLTDLVAMKTLKIHTTDTETSFSLTDEMDFIT